MIRASQLDGMKVRHENGESCGHVFEVHAEKGQVKTLVCGPGGFWQRLGRTRRGRRIAWTEVRSIESGELVIADKGQSGSKPPAGRAKRRG
jgi:sporulation protein YlmC with PRC-barrel domain